MPASISDDHARPDNERVSWSVLAEVECDLDTAVVYGQCEEVVVACARSVLQHQQPGVGVAPHTHLHPVGLLTFLPERIIRRPCSTFSGEIQITSV